MERERRLSVAEAGARVDDAMRTELVSAIDESALRNEIVHVKVADFVAVVDAVEYLEALAREAHMESDFVGLDNDAIDVWAWREGDTPDGKSVWRVVVEPKEA